MQLSGCLLVFFPNDGHLVVFPKEFFSFFFFLNTHEVGHPKLTVTLENLDLFFLAGQGSCCSLAGSPFPPFLTFVS